MIFFATKQLWKSDLSLDKKKSKEQNNLYGSCRERYFELEIYLFTISNKNFVNFKFLIHTFKYKETRTVYV